MGTIPGLVVAVTMIFLSALLNNYFIVKFIATSILVAIAFIY